MLKLKKTQVELLTEYLRGTGRTINAEQARTLFEINNLRARVDDMRNLGLVVNRVEKGTYYVPLRDIFGSRKKLFN